MSNHAPKHNQPDELIGKVVNDRFRILGVIARGGMGRVYRAEQVPLGRLVAVKTLDPRQAGGDQDPSFQQRFFLEASVASKLQHPNTVTVFDYGRTAEGVYFIAMELVEGRSLFSVIREEAPLPAARVVHIALQIARSLREAHRLDVIHRDLKPGNVLLTRHGDEDDFVKVLDFGLVKHVESEAEQELTQAGLFMGSPKYMSPEQIRGERVDPRSDIYALGVVMYEMLTGKAPFERENTVKLLMAHMHEMVPPIDQPGVPPALIELVQRCLAKQPDNRPASMDEMIVLLKQAMGGGPMLSGQYQLSQEIRLSGTPTGALSHHTISGHTLSGQTLSGQTLSGQTMVNRVGPAFPPGAPAQTMTPSQGFSASWGQAAATTSGASSAPAPVEQGQAGWLPKVAVIGALAIAGGFLALRFSERGASTQTPGTSVDPPAATAPAQDLAVANAAAPSQPVEQRPAAPVPAEAPSQFHTIVTINSTPPGAKITADGKAYGETPANIEWWGELAEPGREVTFTLEKDGFDKVTLVRSIKGEKLVVDASLPKTASAASGPSAPRRRAEGAQRGGQAKPGRSPAVLTDDFKNDPY
ncbi:MAG: protein kinase [Myxococcales bacterium]